MAQQATRLATQEAGQWPTHFTEIDSSDVTAVSVDDDVMQNNGSKQDLVLPNK